MRFPGGIIDTMGSKPIVSIMTVFFAVAGVQAGELKAIKVDVVLALEKPELPGKAAALCRKAKKAGVFAQEDARS